MSQKPKVVIQNETLNAQQSRGPMIGVKRSTDAPRILAEGTAQDRYRSAEVVNRLMEDFHGNCYVCEITPLQSMEVEHLLPHKGGAYAQRLFDWNNLLLSCAHCDGAKNRQKYEAGIIDCCRRAPEVLIEQGLAEGGVHVRALAKDDGEAELTADLIEEVFMSDNPRIRRYESEGRIKELQRCMNLLYKNTLHNRATRAASVRPPGGSARGPPGRHVERPRMRDIVALRGPY
jgi:uncharacterized protein (TIGR02646 family)